MYCIVQVSKNEPNEGLRYLYKLPSDHSARFSMYMYMYIAENVKKAYKL